MDPFLVVLLIAIGLGLLTLGSLIRSRSLLDADRRRRLADRTLANRRESGRIGWVLLWLLGVPIPVLLVLYLIRGCT